jgi:hypothetical protein
VEVRKSSLGNGFRRAITAAWNGSASILPGGENVRKGREPVLAPAPVIDRALYSGLD